MDELFASGWPHVIARLVPFLLELVACTLLYCVIPNCAVRWRDGTWLRRPRPDRIVKALGEPLVEIRRGALTDVLRSALSPGTERHGIAVTGVSETAAAGSQNVLVPLREALRAQATVGEVCDALREVWGVYQPAEIT